MFEIRLLSICSFDEVVDLYREMINENKAYDVRLKAIEVDDRTIRNLLQYSFDIENNLFYVAFVHNKAVGFVDSTRVTNENNEDEWYIKAVYLDPEYKNASSFEQLIRRVEKEVKMKGIPVAFSNSLIENGEANSLWSDLGYNLEGKKTDQKVVRQHRCVLVCAGLPAKGVLL